MAHPVFCTIRIKGWCRPCMTRQCWHRQKFTFIKIKIDMLYRIQKSKKWEDFLKDEQISISKSVAFSAMFVYCQVMRGPRENTASLLRATWSFDYAMVSHCDVFSISHDIYTGKSNSNLSTFNIFVPAADAGYCKCPTFSLKSLKNILWK
jgi:hypothetical protein